MKDYTKIELATQIILRKIENNLDDLRTLIIGRQYLEADAEENYNMNMIEIEAIIENLENEGSL